MGIKIDDTGDTVELEKVLSLSLSLYLSLSLSICLCLCLCLFICLCLSLPFTLHLPFYLSFSVSLFLFLSLSFSLTVSFSFFLSLSLSLYFPFFLSVSLSLSYRSSKWNVSNVGRDYLVSTRVRRSEITTTQKSPEREKWVGVAQRRRTRRNTLRSGRTIGIFPDATRFGGSPIR